MDNTDGDKVSMRKFRAAILVGFGLFAGTSSANYPLPVPLEQQRDQADTIVVARAVRTTSCSVDAMQVPCVELGNPVYLKGQAQPATSPHLITYSRVAEARVNCCRRGDTYLMFLRTWGGHLYPVAGRWSVLRISRRR